MHFQKKYGKELAVFNKQSAEVVPICKPRKKIVKGKFCFSIQQVYGTDFWFNPLKPFYEEVFLFIYHCINSCFAGCL